MIRDTVFFETPESRAMSLMVAALPPVGRLAGLSGFLRAGMGRYGAVRRSVKF